MLRLTPRLLVGLVAGGLLVLSTPAVAAPKPSPAPGAPRTASSDPGVLTYGIQAASRAKPDRRPHLDYTVVPHGSVVDYVALSNYSSAPLSLHVYAGDAFTNADGGFDVTRAEGKAKDIGSWVRLANDRITLAPRTRTILPFSLTVPQGATPGDHVGGIVASVSTSSTDGQGQVVTVEHRLVERLYLRVPGALHPSLNVERLTGTYSGTLNPFGRGRASVSYRVTNTGNVRLAGTVDARVRNLLGSRSAGHSELPEILPGSSLVLDGGSRVFPALHATAAVTVHPKPVSKLEKVALEDDSAKDGFWTIPWPLLVLVALGATAWSVYRRRLVRPAGAHAAPRRGLRTTSAVTS